eukprot:g1807.t1
MLENTREFFRMVNGYRRSRDEVNELALKYLPQNFMDQYPSIKVPDDKHLQQEKTTLYDIYSHAENTVGEYDQFLNKVCSNVGLKTDDDAKFEGKILTLTKDKNFKVLTRPPLKSKNRCKEKADNEYAGDVSRLVDIVRCSVVVDNEHDLSEVAKHLLEQNVVVRFKNRFREPLWNGYRDALFNIKIGNFICEVQLHLTACLSKKEESHKYYEFFRTYFCGNMKACRKRMKVMEQLVSSGDETFEKEFSALIESREQQLIKQVASVAKMIGDFQLERKCWSEMILALRRSYNLANAGLSKMDGQLPNPVWDAFRNLSETYTSLGHYDHAIKITSALSEARAAQYGNRHAKYIRAKLMLGDAYFRNQAYWEAYEVLYSIKGAVLKLFGDVSDETLHCMSSLGDVNLALASIEDRAVERKKYQLRGMKIAKLCYEKAKDRFGIESDLSLKYMKNLAKAFQSNNDVNNAKSIYEDLYKLRRMIYGDDHMQTMVVAIDLADCYSILSKFNDAMEIFSKIVPRQTYILGAQHPNTVDAQFKYSKCLHRKAMSGVDSRDEKVTIFCDMLKKISDLDESRMKKLPPKERIMKDRNEQKMCADAAKVIKDKVQDKTSVPQNLEELLKWGDFAFTRAATLKLKITTGSQISRIAIDLFKDLALMYSSVRRYDKSIEIFERVIKEWHKICNSKDATERDNQDYIVAINSDPARIDDAISRCRSSFGHLSLLVVKNLSKSA